MSASADLLLLLYPQPTAVRRLSEASTLRTRFEATDESEARRHARAGWHILCLEFNIGYTRECTRRDVYIKHILIGLICVCVRAFGDSSSRVVEWHVITQIIYYARSFAVCSLRPDDGVVAARWLLVGRPQFSTPHPQHSTHTLVISRVVVYATNGRRDRRLIMHTVSYI